MHGRQLADARGDKTGVQEGLLCTTGGEVVVMRMVEKPEARSQGGGKLGRGIANHRPTTAALRPIFGKGCHHHMATGPERMLQLSAIPLPLQVSGEEMKNSPIMPAIETMGWQCKLEKIAMKPVSPSDQWRQIFVGQHPGARQGQAQCGTIEHGDVLVSSFQQAIHQGGGPPAVRKVVARAFDHAGA